MILIAYEQFKQAGVGPDARFYINDREAILSKDHFDLTVDPPPDLAIEIVNLLPPYVEMAWHQGSRGALRQFE